MKRFLLFLASFLVCICFTAFWAGSVLDIDIPLISNSYTELITEYKLESDVEIDGTVFKTLSSDSWISVDTTAHPKFKYIDIFFNWLSIYTTDNESDYFQIFFSTDGKNYSEEMSQKYKVEVGRNFLKIPDGEYNSLRIDFPSYANSTYSIRHIIFSDKLPLRFRYVIGLVLADLILGALCWFIFYNRSLILRIRLGVFKKYSYLLANLVKKDFTTKYRRSILGVLWSVLNPLLMAVVISVVFSSIMRIQIEHFTVFYLSGSLIFSLMSEATNGSLGSILGAAGLIKKVYIPKYIFPFEKCLFALVNSMFSFIALVILMPILGVPLRPLNFLFFVPMIYVLIFSTGLGMILSAINVFFRDMGHLYGIFVAAWMYLTPIIYPEEIIPPALKGVMNFNPMYYYVTYFRQIMMYDIVPTMRLNLICIAFSVGFLLLGLFVFKKKQDRFILFI